MTLTRHQHTIQKHELKTRPDTKSFWLMSVCDLVTCKLGKNWGSRDLTRDAITARASGAGKHSSAHPMPLEKSAEFGEMYKFKLLGGIEKAQLRHQPS